MSNEARPNDVASSDSSGLAVLVLAHLGEVLGLVVLCFVLAGSAPPHVNEAHYLCKAKHFWQPEWCHRDLFLQSADAHQLFLYCFGWVTKFASLETSRWIGRIVAWFGLALAWHRLSWTLVPRWGISWLSGAIWFTLVQHSQMSGEWILGGVEAKVFAYAFVLAGIADIVQGRWRTSWLWFGLASAFHVLVGGWAVVGAMIAWRLHPRSDRPRLDSMVPFFLVGGLLALPGLVPAMMLGSSHHGIDAGEAWQVYVFQRLRHHLLLSSFPTTFVVRHLLLIVSFCLITRPLCTRSGFRRLWEIVIGAVCLAVIGAVLNVTLGQSAWSARLMRYYWFRSTDVMVPVGVALAAVVWLAYRLDSRSRVGSFAFVVTLSVLMINGVWNGWQISRRAVPPADVQGGIDSVGQWYQWLDVCEWVQQHTDEDALCMTPLNHQTFKWYAQRAELVTWKDVPQDAGSLWQWQQRREEMMRLMAAVELQQLDSAAADWRRLAEKYKFDYCVVREPLGWVLPDAVIKYRNPGYSVYRC